MSVIALHFIFSYLSEKSETCLLMFKLNINMTEIKAIPTSYKGQIFKSKSEAILARFLDLQSCLWGYEPPHYSHKLYVPDFQVIYKLNSGRLMQLLIEYKPCAPSEMYLHKFKNYVHYLDSINHSIDTIPMILYGNFFQSIVKLRDVSYCTKNLFPDGFEDVKHSNKIINGIYFDDDEFKYLNVSLIDDAKKFRFDLK